MKQRSSIVVTLFTRMYASLLVLYPATYRDAYGREMVQVFGDVAHDYYHRQGTIGMLFWWVATILDLIVTVIEQRKEGTTAMAKPISLQPIKGTGLGLLCLLGGLIYVAGGIWLSISGIPSDLTAIQLTHLLRLMWSSAATCGLMGMAVTGGIDDGLVAHVTTWLTGIGLVIISIDALYAIVIHNPVADFTSSALPFSGPVQLLPLVGWLILAVFTMNGNRWLAWTKSAPLGMFLAPPIGLLTGGLLGIRFLPMVIMGLGLILLGLALRTRIEDKRRDLDASSPQTSADAISSSAI